MRSPLSWISSGWKSSSSGSQSWRKWQDWCFDAVIDIVSGGKKIRNGCSLGRQSCQALKKYWAVGLSMPRRQSEQGNQLAETNSNCLHCDKLRMLSKYSTGQITPRHVISQLWRPSWSMAWSIAMVTWKGLSMPCGAKMSWASSRDRCSIQSISEDHSSSVKLGSPGTWGQQRLR